MSNNIWKMKIYSYDCGILDNFVNTLTNMATMLSVGKTIIFLPVDNKRFTYLKSSFVYGASKEHIQIKTHKRTVFLDLRSPDRNMNIFNSLQIPTGITFNIKRVHKKIVG